MSELLKLEGALKTFVDKGFALVLTIAVAMFAFHVGRMAIRKLIHRYAKKKDSPQLATMLSVLLSVWKYFILLIAIIASLNVLGMAITATSLMAAAGAGGLVIGIGAQDFIKDILNGFTIIMEGHFSVGDRVTINGNFGTVTRITLRTTQVIGEKHEIFMIPNSAIGMMTNYSKQNPYIFCYLYITDSAQVEQALTVLGEATKVHTSIFAIGAPWVMGVTGMYPYGTQIGICCESEIAHMLDLQFSVYSAMSLALSKAGICFTSGNGFMTVGKHDGEL